MIMRQLAIRGHETRGKEVIEILEMLGGKTSVKLAGHATLCGYYINQEGCIDYVDRCCFNYNVIQYTLEEFLEKYPYKVGDKVIINDCKDDVYTISEMNWNGERIVYKIRDIDGNIDNSVWWECELLPYKEENFAECIENTVQECLFGKEKTMEEKGDKAKAPNLIGEDYSGKRFGYKIPKGYEFDKIENGNIILKPIKPKYPTTYEDCCKVLGISYRTHLSYTNPDVERGNTYLTKEKQLLNIFMILRICCNAYWKIAGEEMGLGKPWEPDYNEESYEQGSPIKYVIYYTGTCITKERKCTPSYILTFPTEEMRDTFFENFKSLIEECKELL